ncbi:MAG: hypothetical protein SPI18_10195 [Prevotella sp.]|nr:hypothetical protein [Prevotella sp.]
MKLSKYILGSVLCLSLASCELLEPGDIVNPNVDEEAFLKSPNAMQTWVNGTEKNFAMGIGNYCQLMEILSDNYYNNYSRSSNVFDMPRLLNTDDDVKDLQRYAGNMREAADYAFNTVAKYDKNFTDEEKFKMYYIKAYSFILAGEHFTGLPITDGGEVKPWKEHLQLALAHLDLALPFAKTDADKAFVHTLKARTYYRLGDKANATAAAKASLSASADYVKQVMFDGDNGVNNVAQEAIWGNWFQPLPRLDFLDPKYFMIKTNEQRPICLAKAEENHLILAEAALADGNVEEAKQILHQLLALVSARPVQTDLDDHLEGRFNGGTKHYPNSSEYVVAASADDPFRSGLVIDRQAPHLISVSYISGTSVDGEMINKCSTVDETLELVYLMRQEIFIAEGRRVSDLGIRMPVGDVEAAHTPSAQGYTEALIPPFIPLNHGLDAFTMDETTKRVTITYNMNRVIVKNKSSEYVAPFFH